MEIKFNQGLAYGFYEMEIQAKVKNQQTVHGFLSMNSFRYVTIWFLRQDRHFFIVLSKTQVIEKFHTNKKYEFIERKN